MIRVRKPKNAAPPTFLQAARLETNTALTHFLTPGVRKKFEFGAYRRPDVKAALEQIFGGKCAYCEWRYGGGSYFEVEHYRPKSIYYWLAAEWSNLLPSCKRCNNGKLSKFPLLDSKAAATKPGGEVRERPLLLNPADEKVDPSNHLEFDSKDGAIRARMARNRPSERGEASIQVYKLARATLALERKEWAIRVRDKITICHLVALTKDAGRVRQAKEDLKSLLMPHQPFRALTIQILREEGFGN